MIRGPLNFSELCADSTNQLWDDAEARTSASSLTRYFAREFHDKIFSTCVRLQVQAELRAKFEGCESHADGGVIKAEAKEIIKSSVRMAFESPHFLVFLYSFPTGDHRDG